MRVLLVDGEDLLLSAWARVLRPKCHVRTAARGADAIRALQEERFDAVVVEQRLPDLRGVEVLSTARAVQPQARRVLVHAHPLEEARLEDGLAHVVRQKPLDGAALLALLEEG